MTSPSDAGLQAERTGLAWSRTSLGAAGNAALLAIREISHTQVTLALVPAVLALVIAIATGVYGRHRTRVLRHSPLPEQLAATRAIPLLGWTVVALAVLSGIAVIV